MVDTVVDFDIGVDVVIVNVGNALKDVSLGVDVDNVTDEQRNVANFIICFLYGTLEFLRFSVSYGLIWTRDTL